jgi:uncharacterized phage protein (predicted DNA packaging)
MIDFEILSPAELTLDIIKSYLRVDHNLDDVEITLCYQSALTYVKKYIGVDNDEEVDMDLILPILSLTTHFYENKRVTQPSNEKLDEIFGSILALNRMSIL